MRIRQLLRKAKLAVVGLAGLLTFLIILQNTAIVTIEVLFWHVPMSKSVALLAAFLAGVTVGVVGSVFVGKRKGRST